jgi:hypothetical protein
MKQGLLALAVAAAGLAAATATACSHGAPAPVTGKDAGKTPPPTQGAATHHSSEAEPKSAPPSASPAAVGQAAPSPSPGAVVPLAPVVTASAAEAAVNGGTGAPAGSAPGSGKAAAPAGKLPAATTAPAAPASPTPAAAAAPTPAAPTAPAGATAKVPNPSVIVVDTADYDPDSQLTLAEAAKAERERKAETAPPRIIINNKTIHRYAKGGQLTVAEPKKKASPPAPAQAATPTAGTTATAPAVPLQRDEKYWRGRAIEIRQRWRKASDRIKELEDDIALLRRRFYAQDDPYVRDGQIKPAWDRALDELRESRATVQAAKKELTDFLDEGRIAGALPGWLREGVDLEPKEEKPVDPTQPIETPIYKDNGR